MYRRHGERNPYASVDDMFDDMKTIYDEISDKREFGVISRKIIKDAVDLLFKIRDLYYRIHVFDQDL